MPSGRMNKKRDLLSKVYKMALFRQCRFVIYKSRKDGSGDKKMNANAKYPAWVFELYARYFEELAPDEEALSIDEYAECLGFKGDEEE